MDTAEQDSAASDRLLEQRKPEQYVLKLFVSGLSPRSTAALGVLRSICDEHLVGRYSLEVVDIYEQPDLVSSYDILASPMLLRVRPLPERRLIGDLSDRTVVLRTLDLG